MSPTIQALKTYGVPYLHWYVAGTIALIATNYLSVTIPMVVARGIDHYASSQDPNGMFQFAVQLVGLGALMIVVRTASRLLFFTPGRLVEARIRQDLFHSMLRHQPTFLRRWPTGDLTSRLTSDAGMVRLLFGFATLGLINTVFALLFAGRQMYIISPTLAMMSVLPLGVGFLISSSFVRRFGAIMRTTQEQTAALSDQVLTSYQGIATVHAFRAEPALLRSFSEKNNALLFTLLKRARLRIAFGPVLTLSAALNIFILLFFGGPMVIEGTLTVGELVAYTTLIQYLKGPLRGLSFIVSLLKQSEAGINRIYTILGEAPLRPDLPNPSPAPNQAPKIELKHLTFSFPGADEPALTDVSVCVPKGGLLGLFGPTGSGKTALIRCISREFNPPKGTVFIDDTDIITVDLDDWRTKMSVIPQRAFLFSETVKDNILLGYPDTTLDEILERTALKPDLAALPDGINTKVGEAGLTLSGGQRQRVAIARGLIREHHLLILDDVLSAVDHATEAALLAGLRSTKNKPTTILAANRLTALRNADVILVLENGAVTAKGTHTELISQPGIYADAWAHQQDGADE